MLATIVKSMWKAQDLSCWKISDCFVPHWARRRRRAVVIVETQMRLNWQDTTAQLQVLARLPCCLFGIFFWFWCLRFTDCWSTAGASAFLSLFLVHGHIFCQCFWVPLLHFLGNSQQNCQAEIYRSSIAQEKMVVKQCFRGEKGWQLCAFSPCLLFLSWLDAWF